MRARTVPEVDMVRTVMDALSREAGELVHISRLQGFDLVDVYHAEHHDHPVRVSFDAYGLPPLFATSSGKVYLAFSPGGLLDLALADPRTWLPGGQAPDRDALVKELRAITRRGYACNRDALRLGVSSVAIPVFDAAGRTVATCSVAYPTGRGGRETEARLARLLMLRGRDICEAIGGGRSARCSSHLDTEPRTGRVMKDGNFLKENNAHQFWHPMAHLADNNANPPTILTGGEGVFITDVDGHRSIDAVGACGT